MLVGGHLSRQGRKNIDDPKTALNQYHLTLVQETLAQEPGWGVQGQGVAFETLPLQFDVAALR